MDEYFWWSKLKNVYIYKDRYATGIVTDVNKISTIMLFYPTYLYHVYMILIYYSNKFKGTLLSEDCL